MNEYKIKVEVWDNRGLIPRYNTFTEIIRGSSGQRVMDDFVLNMECKFGYELTMGELSYKTIDITKL